MAVTTIKLEGTLASRGDMNALFAKTIETFEAMCRASNCQIINVTTGDEARGLLGRKQVVTVIWTGTSNTIKPTYTAYPNYGLFGVVTSVDLKPY